MSNRISDIHTEDQLMRRWRLFQLGLIVFSLALIFLPANDSVFFSRYWGFDNLFYFPVYVWLPTLLFLIATLLPAVQAKILSSFLSPPRRYYLSKPIVYCCILVLSGCLFWLLRVKFYFLGDFNIRMLQSIKGDFVATEYLTMWLLNKLNLAGTAAGFTSENIFKTSSAVVGAFYVLVSISLANQLSKNSRCERLIIWSTFFFSAQLLVFCGYVEVYFAPVFTLLLFSYFLIRYYNNTISAFWLIASYLLALATHTIAIAALPVLLYALVNKSAWFHNLALKFSAVKWIGIVFLLAIAGCTIIYAIGHKFLMPLAAPPDQSNRLLLFSATHMWEFFNAQILCSGPAIIFLPYLLFRQLRKKISFSNLQVSFLLYALGMLLITFVSDLQRGSGDWDIMSFTATPLLLSTLLTTQKLFDNRKRLLIQILIPLICFNMINSFSWMVIHHTNLSIGKITNMLRNDPASYYQARISGYTQLAFCFQNNRLYREAEQAALIACETSKPQDVTACLIYARRLMESQREQKAAAFLEGIITTRNRFALDAYLTLLPYYEKNNLPEKLQIYLKRLYLAYEEKPEFFTYHPNFNAGMMAGLFGELYKVEATQLSPTERVRMKKTIDALLQLKP